MFFGVITAAGGVVRGTDGGVDLGVADLECSSVCCSRLGLSKNAAPHNWQVKKDMSCLSVSASWVDELLFG